MQRSILTRPRAANKRLDAPISLATAWQVTSRDDPEPLKRDQTRQVQPDWTQVYVRSFSYCHTS
jgi:hypothetical protein